MDLIPVVDLKHGQVVHARMGDRSAYAPIASRLCRGADPLAIVQSLLDLHPFRRLYFADLDAIQRQGDHLRALSQLRAHFPDVEFWVDAGIADEASLRAWTTSGIGRPVIGSESLRSVVMLSKGTRSSAAETPVLSLDFIDGEFLGPAALLRNPSSWPGDVLAMNLRRVGSESGPDLSLISRLARMAPRCRVHASGGIRHVDDLAAAHAAGAAGALLATALHDGSIDAAQLRAYSAFGGR